MLEDGGGSGSAGAHFEKIVFANETMVSDDTRDAAFSRMTLAVTKDSGFYEIDLEKGDNYTWGKGKGCGMTSLTCDSALNSHFCTSSATVCTDDLLYRGSCHSSTFTGSCSISLQAWWCKEERGKDNSFYYYGHDAICLPTRVSLISILHSIKLTRPARIQHLTFKTCLLRNLNYLPRS